MNVSFASPSYRRPYCITAHYIPETRVYVDPSEVGAYEEANGGFGEIVACDEGVQGNLPRVRNHILDREFGRGADAVVMMDDDVESLSMFSMGGDGFGYTLKKLDADGVRELIEYGTTLCNEWGFGMWGVNKNDDKLLYKHFRPFSTNRCGAGQLMVFTKDELRFDESLPLKEDYDMCVQQMNRYRGLLLINFVHVNADMGAMAGGTSVRRNYEREREQYMRFKRKWGSEIVRGAGTSKGQGKSRTAAGFLNKYDFSHPIVKVPIQGV